MNTSLLQIASEEHFICLKSNNSLIGGGEIKCERIYQHYKCYFSCSFLLLDT